MNLSTCLCQCILQSSSATTLPTEESVHVNMRHPDIDMQTKDPEIEMIVKASEALKQRGLRIIRFAESLEYEFTEYYFLNSESRTGHPTPS